MLVFEAGNQPARRSACRIRRPCRRRCGGARGGQHLVDAAHGRDLSFVGVHLLLCSAWEHRDRATHTSPCSCGAGFRAWPENSRMRLITSFLAGFVDHQRPRRPARGCSTAPQVVGVGDASPVRQRGEDVADAGPARQSSSLRVSSSVQPPWGALWPAPLFLYEFAGMAERVFVIHSLRRQ